MVYINLIFQGSLEIVGAGKCNFMTRTFFHRTAISVNDPHNPHHTVVSRQRYVKVYTKHQDLTQASKHHKQMRMSYSPLRRVSWVNIGHTVTF